MIRNSIHRYFLVGIFVLLFGIVFITPCFAQPVRLQSDADTVQIILESPVYDPQTETYLLTIRISEPEKVAAIEIIVDNLDLGQTIVTSPPISVLNQSVITYQLNMKGQPGGEYVVKVRAIDYAQKYFQRQRQYGSGNPLDLATAKIKYVPPRPPTPTFSIISVKPDLENRILYIRLDVPEGQDIVAYEGFLLDKTGQEIAQYPPTEFPGTVIQEALPPAMVEAQLSGSYKLLLYLLNRQGIRSDPQEFEFEFIPPPPPSVFKRIQISLKTHPGIFFGILLIVLLLVVWLVVKNRKSKQKLSNLPRPPVDRTNLQHSGGNLAAGDRTPSARRPFADEMILQNAQSPRLVPPQRNAGIRSAMPSLQTGRPSSQYPQQTFAQEAFPSKTVELLILDTPQYAGPKKIVITQFPFIVGRSKCDLILKDAQVSRQHFRIDLHGDEVFVMDLNSSNGTFLDGQKLTPQKSYPLTRKVTIRLGGKTIFELIPKNL